MKPICESMVLLAWIACVLMTGVGCATIENTCVIDATIQEARLHGAGLDADVGFVCLDGRRHAVVVWVDRDGKRWVWDRGGSMSVVGDEGEIARVVGFRWERKCVWIGWR